MTEYLFDPDREALVDSGERQRDRLQFFTASDEDLEKLSEQKLNILNLLRCRWISASDLIKCTGATSATRRVRELRQDGFEIVRKGSGRVWFYKYTGKKRNGQP